MLCLLRSIKMVGAMGVVLIAVLLGALSQAPAQSRSDEADAARAAAEAKAESKLGYPDVYDLYVGSSQTPADLYALSQQMARLAAFIKAYGENLETAMEGSGASGLPDPLLGVGGAGPQARYGPDGPTAETVRMFLDYRLMVVGNPRLKSGPISEDENNVYVQIVTTDNSLVEAYVVNKQTGHWVTQR